MLISRALSSVSRSVCARSVLLSAPKKLQSPGFTNQLSSILCESPIKAGSNDVRLIHYSSFNPSIFQRFGMTSSASREASEKDNGSGVVNAEASKDAKVSAEGKEEESTETKVEVSDSTSESQPDSGKKRRRGGTTRTEFSDSESENEDLSEVELAKLVMEKDELLKVKQKEIEAMKDKVVRTLAEMENVMARTKRDAENSKKFAIQSFAKSLLDVADNLGRASSHVKSNFSKIDESKDSNGALPHLKTLLEGVEMTEKQLLEIFKKHGIEKYDPTNEPFDPYKHNAVFQVPDGSKPAGTVAHVLKAGYMLFDRVIRPAEVGVTQAPENDVSRSNEGEKGSQA